MRKTADQIIAEAKSIDISVLVPDILVLADRIRNTLLNRRKVFLFGNGGSAAEAQHLAAEGLGIALNDVSYITAIGNDTSFEEVFARQLLVKGSAGDFALALSTSGESKNVLLAVKSAPHLGIGTGALTATQGKLKDMVQIAVCVPHVSTPRIQEAHLLIGHILCELCNVGKLCECLF